MKVHLLYLAICMTLVGLGESNSFCTQEMPLKGEKPRPKLKESYSTQISERTIGTDYVDTALITEYFDALTNKVAIGYSMHSSSVLEYLQVLNVKEQTMLISLGGKCYYSNLTEDTVSDLNKDTFRYLEMNYKLGTNWKFKGNKEIRGVSVNQWRSCVNEYFIGNYTADFYFTSDDDSPYRLEIIGVKPGMEKLHKIFDYFLYNKAQPSPDAFKPPPGEICEGSGITQVTTPPMATSASYTEEEIDLEHKFVSSYDVLYDKENLLEKDEFSAMRLIYDFKRGIKFTIDKATNDCEIKPFYGIGRLDMVDDKNGQIHMATMKHFFLDEGKFTYNGVYTIRGIPCDLYTKKDNSAESLGASVVELYIARPDVNMMDIRGLMATSNTTIVRCVLKGGQPLKVIKEYNIYDYVPDPFPAHKPYDISSCYEKNRKIDFYIEYEGEHEGTAIQLLRFVYNANTQINKALRVSSLRVQLTYPQPGPGKIGISGTLYDNEDSVDLFKASIYKNTILPADSTQYVVFKKSTNTPSLCAHYCATKQDRPFYDKGLDYCYSFDFEKITKTCTFFFYWTRNFKPNATTDSYSRSYTGYNDYKTKDIVWSDFKELVRDGMISITDGKGKQFVAVSVTEKKAVINNPFEKLLLTHFKQLKDSTFSGQFVKVVSSFNIDECAQQCATSLQFECEGIEFDQEEEKCYLYNTRNTRKVYNPSETISYLRDYVSDFEQRQGYTFLSASNYVYDGVFDADRCAKLCQKQKSFTCRSFELCGQTCVLGPTHIYQAPKSNIKKNPTCVHFSRNYIQDYDKYENKIALKDSNVIENKNIGLKQCAASCSISSSNDCDAFEYCPVTSSCRISTKSVGNINNSSMQTSKSCNLYTRMKGLSKAASFTSNSNSDGYSAGKMGGMAIGMILLGLILIIVIALVVFKIRSSPFNELSSMKVGFSKRKLEEDS